MLLYNQESIILAQNAFESHTTSENTMMRTINLTSIFVETPTLPLYLPSTKILNISLYTSLSQSYFQHCKSGTVKALAQITYNNYIYITKYPLVGYFKCTTG